MVSFQIYASHPYCVVLAPPFENVMRDVKSAAPVAVVGGWCARRLRAHRTRSICLDDASSFVPASISFPEFLSDFSIQVIWR